MGSLSEIRQQSFSPWNSLKDMLGWTREQYQSFRAETSRINGDFAREAGQAQQRPSKPVETGNDSFGRPQYAQPPVDPQARADEDRTRFNQDAPGRMDREAAQRDWKMRMGMPVAWGRDDPTSTSLGDWMGGGSFGDQSRMTSDWEGSAAGSEDRARADSRLEQADLRARERERQWRQANGQGWAPMADGEKLRADSAESLVRARREDVWKEFYRKNTGKLWTHTPEESAGKYSGPAAMGMGGQPPSPSPVSGGQGIGRPAAPRVAPAQRFQGGMGLGMLSPSPGSGGQPPSQQGIGRPAAPRVAPAQTLQGATGLSWQSPTRETGSRLSPGYGQPPSQQGYGGQGRPQGNYPRRF